MHIGVSGSPYGRCANLLNASLLFGQDVLAHEMFSIMITVTTAWLVCMLHFSISSTHENME